MQKFEYKIIRENAEGEVFDGTRKVRKKNFFGEFDGPNLLDYINQLGKEGWEAVGFSVKRTGVSGEYTEPYVLLKRIIGE